MHLLKDLLNHGVIPGLSYARLGVELDYPSVSLPTLHIL